MHGRVVRGRLTLAVGAVMVLVAAGVAHAMGDRSVGSSPSSGSDPSPSGAGRVVSVAARQPLPADATVPGCPDATGHLPAGSSRAVLDAFAGVWVQCSDTSPLGEGGATEVGLEITTGGTWYRVHRAADGALTRGHGVGQEGSVRVFVPSGEDPLAVDVQLDLVDLAGYYRIVRATRWATPAVLTLADTMSPTVGGFVRWEGAPPTDGTPAALAEGCPAATDAVSPVDAADAGSRLTETWIRCSPNGIMPAGWGPPEVGIELTADGSWYRVVRGDDGRAVRGTGPSDTGSYSVETQGTALILKFMVPGAMLPAQAVLFDEPRLLYVVAYPFNAAAYVPWDGTPLPEPPPPSTLVPAL